MVPRTQDSAQHLSLPLRARAELNSQENIWQFMRQKLDIERSSNPSTTFAITVDMLEHP